MGMIILIYSCSKNNNNGSTAANCKQSITIPTQISNWILYGENTQTFLNPGAGVYEQVGDSIKFFGQAYRKGSRLSTKDDFCVKNTTLYIKWKAFTAGQFTNLNIDLYYHKDASAPEAFQRMDLTNFTAISSYNGSTIAAQNTWYYTRVRFLDGTFTSVTATGNYDSNGGSVVETLNKSIQLHAGWISFLNGDAYGGSSTWGMLAECKLIDN